MYDFDFNAFFSSSKCQVQVGCGRHWIAYNQESNITINRGLEYLVTDSFAVGSHMTLNFLPEKTLGQRFFFGWQMLGARYSF